MSVAYSGTIPSPVGRVAINEIMWNPSVPNAQYVELFNNSTNVTYDLSGWQLQGLSYTFPSGSLLPPLGFLVLAANAPAFAAACGATNPVFDTFDATLSPGQLLSLLQPAAGSNLVVAQVLFDDALPWPTNANNPGVALQVIDPRQDNWRAGNWSAGPTNPPSLAATPTEQQRRRQPPALPPALDQRGRTGQSDRHHEQRRRTRALAGTLQPQRQFRCVDRPLPDQRLFQPDQLGLSRPARSSPPANSW